jgi:hypothetical protein
MAKATKAATAMTKVFFMLSTPPMFWKRSLRALGKVGGGRHHRLTLDRLRGRCYAAATPR